MIFVDIYDYATGKFLATFDIEWEDDWINVDNFKSEYELETIYIIHYQLED